MTYQDWRTILGIEPKFTFPFDVKIQIEDIGGPSAGTMFALGIIDKLTPGDLTGGQFVAGDVTKSADWARLVREAGAELAIVVNNAGWTHRKKPYLEVSEAEFDRVYAVNVKSVYLSAMHAVPVFRRRGGGAMVNIASTAGVRPRPGLAVYNSSKAAVILMSKSMAAEFGPDKIRVNCVNPVFSPDTGLSAEFAGGAITEEVKKRYMDTIPLGRFSTPLDVANACLYLASDEASFISGVCIEVDGARCV